MKFIKKTIWQDVFQSWKDSEADNLEWIHCATKIKGWPDWESWRNHTATQLNLQKRDWSLFEFDDPINEIPQMLIGPFSGWQSRFSKKNSASFFDLVNSSRDQKQFKNYEKIASILDSQAFDANLIGIVREDVNKVVCIEGHHRAMALAIAQKEGIEINFKKPIRIALTKLPKKEIFLLDETLKRGSSK